MQGRPLYPGRHSSRRHRMSTARAREHRQWLLRARAVERRLVVADRSGSAIPNVGDWLGTIRLATDLLVGIGV